MKRLIYQVSIGKPSKLYEKCIQSVREYCEYHKIDHFVQRSPKLWIKPDPFTSNRSEGATKFGCLPIFEKENAFEYLHEYDQVAIIDADIYIRPNSPNIFDDLEEEYSFGAVPEMDMPINAPYIQKIKNYSHMQYQSIAKKDWRYETSTGFEFMNMGVMVMNKSFLEYLDGMTPKQFIEQSKFKDFVDGKGNWKWSTDQTLLNTWIRKRGVPFKRMDWKWNGLYSALQEGKVQDSYFVHFFLKDKLPNNGENVEQLMQDIQ